MLDDPKIVKEKSKKYNKLITKLLKGLKSKKIKVISNPEFLEIISLAEAINDKEQISYIYNNYKNSIPNLYMERVEKLLGIQKIAPAKAEEKKPVQKPVIKQEPIIHFSSERIEEYRDSFSMDLSDRTTLTLNHLKEEGFLFGVAKKYKTPASYQEKVIMDEVLTRSNMKVFWTNQTDIKVEINHNVEQFKFIDALEKYKDDVLFMMQLNYLLGLDIFTPYEAYVDDYVNKDELPRIRVRK